MRESNILSLEQIKDLASDLKMTHKELADLIGVERSQVSQWFKGHRNPSKSSLAAMSYALKSVK